MKSVFGNVGWFGMLLAATCGLAATPRALASTGSPVVAPEEHPPVADTRTPASETRSPLRDAATPPLTPWSAEVLKLTQAGVDEKVVLAFIRGAGTFNLAPAHLEHFQTLGVSETLLAAMQARDAELGVGRPLGKAGGMRLPAVKFEPAPQADTLTALPSVPEKPSRVPLRGLGGQVAALAPDEILLAQMAVGRAEQYVAEQVGTELPGVLPTDEARAAPGRSPESRAERYPVRKPYPEPLTAPVILIPGPTRVPNTLVIEWLPKP